MDQPEKDFQIPVFVLGEDAMGGIEDIQRRNMIHIITYDISKPKRLRMVAKICEDYGVRVQKSVFECDLPENVFVEMWMRLIGVLDEEEDLLVSYRVCKSCARGSESAGKMVRPVKRFVYLF
jgi:CRISPR-associated protein Cas2